MNYALKQHHHRENVAGLAVVVALHAVALYFLATAAVRGIGTTAPPKPIDIIKIYETPKPPVPIVTSVDIRPSVTVLSVPLVIDNEITISELPPASASNQINAADVSRVPESATVAQAKDGAPGASAALGVACPNAQRVREEMRYPPAARREGIQGDVMVRFVVGLAGEIKNINILNSSNRALSSAAVSAVKQFSCAAQGRDVTVEVPFSFRLSD
jgi:periplasmic protein TonB